jgi:hypothetical protein
MSGQDGPASFGEDRLGGDGGPSSRAMPRRRGGSAPGSRQHHAFHLVNIRTRDVSSGGTTERDLVLSGRALRQVSKKPGMVASSFLSRMTARM